MIRATTPTFNLTISGDIDLTLAEKVYVSVVQRLTEIELTGESLEVDGNRISCWLTQQQSLRLIADVPAKIQVNWIYIDENGETKRAATVVKKISIGEQLLKRVLT